MNLVRNFILDSDPSGKKRVIGLNAEQNQYKIMDIIPKFANFFLQYSFNDLETFPSLDFVSLNDEVSKKQQRAQHYNVSIVWMSCKSFFKLNNTL